MSLISLNAKRLERDTGISRKIKCAVLTNDSLSLTTLAKIFPELSGLESASKDEQPLNPGQEKILGAPFGMDEWLVLKAYDSQDAIIQSLHDGECSIGTLTEPMKEDKNNPQVLQTSWRGSAPWIAILDTLHYAHPALYNKLMRGAQRLESRKPIWAELVENGTLKNSPDAPSGKKRVTRLTADPAP